MRYAPAESVVVELTNAPKYDIGARRVAGLAKLDSKLTVTFSGEMDPATVTSETFTVRQGTTAVAGTVACSGVTAVFTPASDLASNTTYTATITTGARDLAGNALASDYVWSFTTGAAPDVIKPTVTFLNPADGAIGVSINKAIAATFS